jgi:hypothetical protein
MDLRGFTRLALVAASSPTASKYRITMLLLGLLLWMVGSAAWLERRTAELPAYIPGPPPIPQPVHQEPGWELSCNDWASVFDLPGLNQWPRNWEAPGLPSDRCMLYHALAHDKASAADRPWGIHAWGRKASSRTPPDVPSCW